MKSRGSAATPCRRFPPVNFPSPNFPLRPKYTPNIPQPLFILLGLVLSFPPRLRPAAPRRAALWCCVAVGFLFAFLHTHPHLHPHTHTQPPFLSSSSLATNRRRHLFVSGKIHPYTGGPSRPCASPAHRNLPVGLFRRLKVLGHRLGSAAVHQIAELVRNPSERSPGEVFFRWVFWDPACRHWVHIRPVRTWIHPPCARARSLSLSSLSPSSLLVPARYAPDTSAIARTWTMQP